MINPSPPSVVDDYEDTCICLTFSVCVRT